jgi:D-galactarolactone cycloisomerase
LQLLAVLPPLTPPALADSPPWLEFDCTEHPIRQAILTAPFRPEGGVIRIPEGPGLGIEIDRAALARFREES